MIDYTKARTNMVYQQVQPWSVSDDSILNFMSTIPRERFCPAPFASLAYADVEIPIGHQQTLLAPPLVARFLQALNLKKSDTVLEIGTGTGYVTALLSHLVKHVFSIEIHDALSEQAKTTLAELGCLNTHCHVGNGAQGWAAQAPFDAIIATGAYHYPPHHLEKQLKPGGRLLAVVGSAPIMQACLFEPGKPPQFLFETLAPYLMDIECPKPFSF